MVKISKQIIFLTFFKYLIFVSISVKVHFIPLRDFMDWFENKLNDKFDSSLQGIKLRFLSLYNILKGILTYMIEMNQLVRNTEFIS